MPPLFFGYSPSSCFFFVTLQIIKRIAIQVSADVTFFPNFSILILHNNRFAVCNKLQYFAFIFIVAVAAFDLSFTINLCG